MQNEIEFMREYVSLLDLKHNHLVSNQSDCRTLRSPVLSGQKLVAPCIMRVAGLVPRVIMKRLLLSNHIAKEI